MISRAGGERSLCDLTPHISMSLPRIGRPPCATDILRCVCWNPRNNRMSLSWAWLMNCTSAYFNRSLTRLHTSAIDVNVASSSTSRTYLGRCIGSTEHSAKIFNHWDTNALNSLTIFGMSKSREMTNRRALSSMPVKNRMKSRLLLSKPASASVAELCVALPSMSSMFATNVSYSFISTCFFRAMALSRTTIASSYELTIRQKYITFGITATIIKISLCHPTECLFSPAQNK
mmetsp:Transcript_41373/g.124915  ORF Transcript_41373/g.124915 Transcript_41373/m.124915 type:complete len:232 (-) Transcript_41373:329-1024(-)